MLDTVTDLDRDDADLKQLAGQNRAAAVSVLVHRHRPRLLRHAAGILRDDDAAADVVQEVFIKALREPRLFDTDFRVGAWLWRVTSNLCLNNVRDHKRRGDILASIPQRTAADADQVESIQGEQRHAAIEHAMGGLSAPHREILQARFYQDRSYTEIAEVLDLKLGTVMSRLSRAKAALEQLLDPRQLADL